MPKPKEMTKAVILETVEAAREQLDKIPVQRAGSPLHGFINFVREQGVVGLAVGLILGVAAKSIIDSIVFNVFNPIIGVLTGGVKLSENFICIKSDATGCISKVNYGQLASDLISFFIILAVVYFVFKILKLDRLDKKKDS